MKREHIVLLVEDSDDDAYFMDRAVNRSGMNMVLKRVCNGQEAIDYLQGFDLFSDRSGFPLPDLIMLDLKMPICDGFDFLAWKQMEPALAHLPTIVMTSSDMPRDVRRSYELGAHSFTTKLLNLDSLKSRMEALRDWWFRNCILLTTDPESDETRAK